MADDELTYEPLEQPGKGKKKPLRKTPMPRQAQPKVPRERTVLPQSPALQRFLQMQVEKKSDASLKQEILYVIRLDQCNPRETQSPTIRIETWWRNTGEGDKQPKQLYLDESTLAPTPDDAKLFALLLKIASRASSFGFDLPTAYLEHFGTAVANGALRAVITENGARKMRRMSFSQEKATLKIASQLLPSGKYEVIPYLVQGDTALSFSTISHIFQPPWHPPLPRKTAFVISENQIIQADLLGGACLLGPFTGRHSLEMDVSEAERFTFNLTSATELPIQDAPGGQQLTQLQALPTGQLYVRTAKYLLGDKEMLHCEVSFAYGNFTVEDSLSDMPEMRITRGTTVILRDALEENRLKTRLTQLGFRFNKNPAKEEIGWKLEPAQLDNAVRTLVMEGWKVNAQGKSYTKPTVKMPSVSSGLDWFEMSSGISFDGKEIPVPELLSACKNGGNTVVLDDGTYGILPEEWLLNFTALTQLGEVHSEKLRFRIQQATIVNALLDQRLAEASQEMRTALAELEAVETPAPAKAPASFNATLRQYQEVGLGWLMAMQKAHLGACLADDMGLGKTIQVLALLEDVRLRPSHLPSLVVLPFSLIFNWQEECRKFAPQMRTLVHHGAGRRISQELFNKYDIVFTTYGTLRNDAPKMSGIDFEYCILDESQNIKNHDSSSAQAARCIKAHHRIAMTGTPIENSLAELFSQLDFLNPGMFNISAFLKKGQASIEALRNGVKPFILRRTKQEVAKDLPPKTEQLLFCNMEDDEKEQYDQLLAYYQKELFGDEGNKPQDMQVLAALTRLRQAACHPGLLNPAKSNANSAKLELLLENLEAVVAEGHKALVFSQFTSFLKIIRVRLEKLDIGYCYLDGETKDRAQLVASFGNDPDKKVFLISLKAGGVGLNLTAAEYVYLVDPWWNPAAEAQAIDRAYRIGQTCPVFAYRLVTKDTIEERVMQLQNAKRRLADTVINEGSGLPAKLNREDLRALLSR